MLIQISDTKKNMLLSQIVQFFMMKETLFS
jgi:hypothetical protein